MARAAWARVRPTWLSVCRVWRIVSIVELLIVLAIGSIAHVSIAHSTPRHGK